MIRDGYGVWCKEGGMGTLSMKVGTESGPEALREMKKRGGNVQS